MPQAVALRLSDGLYEQMLAFTREVSTMLNTGSPFWGEVGGEINFFIAKLNAKLKVEDQTRKEVREKVNPRLSTLLETVDQVARSIEAERGKRLLAIVEDLGKVKTTFMMSATSSSVPAASRLAFTIAFLASSPRL